LAALNAEPLLAEADAALSNTTAVRYNRRRQGGIPSPARSSPS
jgi:hypothetical protein